MKIIYCCCVGCQNNDKHGECSLDSITISGNGMCTNKYVSKSWGGHEGMKNESKGKAGIGKTT